jgi:hypothetical protein
VTYGEEFVDGFFIIDLAEVYHECSIRRRGAKRMEQR